MQLLNFTNIYEFSFLHQIMYFEVYLNTTLISDIYSPTHKKLETLNLETEENKIEF